MEMDYFRKHIPPSFRFQKPPLLLFFFFLCAVIFFLQISSWISSPLRFPCFSTYLKLYFTLYLYQPLLFQFYWLLHWIRRGLLTGQRRRPPVGPEASGRCGGADVAGIFVSAVAAGATCWPDDQRQWPPPLPLAVGVGSTDQLSIQHPSQIGGRLAETNCYSSRFVRW
jgi:hypothetical protein